VGVVEVDGMDIYFFKEELSDEIFRYGRRERQREMHGFKGVSLLEFNDNFVDKFKPIRIFRDERGREFVFGYL
jgi:hypothetical protein